MNLSERWNTLLDELHAASHYRRLDLPRGQRHRIGAEHDRLSGGGRVDLDLNGAGEVIQGRSGRAAMWI